MPQQADSEITILRESIIREATHVKKCVFPKCADGARDNGNAIQQVKCPPVEILAGNILNGLPLGENADFVPDFHVAGDCTNRRIRKVLHHRAPMASTSRFVSASMQTTNSPSAL